MHQALARPNPLARLLDFVGRHATRFMAGGVLVGLVVPPLADLLRPLLLPFLLIPLTIALVRMDWSGLTYYARKPLLIAILTVWILLASPLLMWGVLPAGALPQPLHEALILMAAAPPIVSSAAIALFVGLDAALSVVAIVITTALVPITLPMLALALLGIEIEIGLAAFMLRLGAMVGAAFAVAIAVRYFSSPAWLQRNARLLDGLSVTNLILFAIAIMAGVTAAAFERPGYVLLVLVVSFVANLALQAIGVIAFLPLGRKIALTIGWLTGNCNMGLVLVSLADRASFDIVIYFAVAQLPMYMLPAMLLPLYRRLLRN